MTLNESMIAAIVVAVMAGFVVVGLLVKMYLTTGTLEGDNRRISELEASDKKTKERLKEIEDEWRRFKEANGIDKDGSAHPWRISVFHTPRRRTA